MAIFDLFKKKGMLNVEGFTTFDGMPGSSPFHTRSNTTSHQPLNPALRLLSETVSSYDLQIIDREKKLLKSPYINLFNRPNIDQDYDDFIAELVINYKLYKTTYVYFKKADSIKVPISMHVATKASLQPQTDASGNILYYRLVDKTSISTIPIEDVITFTNPLNGLIDELSSIMQVDQAIIEYQVGFFNNGALPSAIATIEADRPVFQAIKESLTQQMRGSGNNNKVFYARKDPNSGKSIIDYQTIDSKNNDLDMESLFKRIDKKVTESVGVPKELLGSVDSTNLAGVKIAQKLFDEYTITPILRKIESKFNNWLTNTMRETYTIKLYKDIELTKEDELIDAQITSQRANAAKVLVEAGYTLESAAVTVGLEETLVVNKIDTIKSVKKKVTKAAETINFPITESEIDKVLSNFLDQQYKLVKETNDIDIENESKKLSLLLIPVLYNILVTAGKDNYKEIANTLNITGNSYVENNAIRASLETYVKEVAISFNADTKDVLQKLTRSLNTEEITVSEYKKAVYDYYKSQGEYIDQSGKLIKNNAQYRATRLARTETTNMHNKASLDAAHQLSRDTGVQMVKIWKTSGDSIVCPICKTLDGTVAELSTPFIKNNETLDLNNGKTFTNEWRTIHTCPAHAQCRCRLYFEVK